MFRPPRCPNSACRQHQEPEARFCRRNGFYRARCRRRPIQRYLCRTCGRGFSRQTFQLSYRDHKPHLNAPLFRLLLSGAGFRESSRRLGLSLTCTLLKYKKIARYMSRQDLDLRGPLEPGKTLRFADVRAG